MELKPGYKQTEVGVIPDEWDCKSISEITLVPVQNGVFNEPARKGKGCKLINVSDLYASSPINVDALELFDANKSEIVRFGVQHGDIFFTRSSVTPDGIAQCNVYEEKCKQDIVFDCHLIRARASISKANPFYVFRYCTTSQARKYLTANAKMTTMTTIDQGVIANMPVPLPPLPEQRAIATALSDVDSLVASLDKLIAKKRDMKQAAMQELLTGKRRLPGFSGEWEVKRLGEIGSCLRGVTYKGDSDLSPHDTAHTRRLLRSNNVQDSSVTTIDIQFVNTARVSENQLLRENDILICMANGSKALVGKAGLFRISDGYDYTFGAFMGCYRTNFEGYNPTFVFCLFQTGRYRDYINLLLAGSSINNLNPSSIESLEFSMPLLPEQTAIASILSDMDTELASLEQKRDKTRLLKQGMMQELLTGRIRLV